jgi:hypothetical protein
MTGNQVNVRVHDRLAGVGTIIDRDADQETAKEIRSQRSKGHRRHDGVESHAQSPAQPGTGNAPMPTATKLQNPHANSPCVKTQRRPDGHAGSRKRTPTRASKPAASVGIISRECGG